MSIAGAEGESNCFQIDQAVADYIDHSYFLVGAVFVIDRFEEEGELCRYCFEMSLMGVIG